MAPDEHRTTSFWGSVYEETGWGEVHLLSDERMMQIDWCPFPNDEFDSDYECECTTWCADWTPPGPDDTIGLLWDADEGSLTVYINRERKGIANVKKWCGE